MLGTLNGALEVSRVTLAPGALTAAGEGINVLRDGLPVLSEVRIRYALRIPAGARETVERALAKHQDKCPTAATLKPAVAVSWTAKIVEEPAA